MKNLILGPSWRTSVSGYVLCAGLVAAGVIQQMGWLDAEQRADAEAFADQLTGIIAQVIGIVAAIQGRLTREEGVSSEIERATYNN